MLFQNKTKTASRKTGGFFMAFLFDREFMAIYLVAISSYSLQSFIFLRKTKGFPLLSGLGTRFHKKIIYLYLLCAKKNELHADIKQTIRVELITNFVAPSPNIVKFLKSKDSKADTKTLNK